MFDFHGHVDGAVHVVSPGGKFIAADTKPFFGMK